MQIRSIKYVYIWHTVTIIVRVLSVIPLFFLVHHSLLIFLAFLIFIYSSLSFSLEPPSLSSATFYFLRSLPLVAESVVLS